ncbi:DNA ligase (ATP) [Caulobacter phage Cr30]|uniref:DNA ligase (ATP) n=1 Tax=Caulobacter phage Cr30 TaxID=1357714 RepID=UPI0004A9BB81|nr:DNA ligase (ATP) [Caulobacter phage Cr30]AGS80982.1 DNA ligase (ATP) [Caulobacter phage Cr30]
MTIQEYPKLYKKDTKGKVRLWWMERDGNRYRTWDGTQDGKQKASEWKTVFGKGIGKAKKTDEEQAISEIESIYKKKLESSYHESIDNIDQAVKFDPMLAATYKDWFSIQGPGIVYSQPKYDGIRLIAKKDGLFSRGGKPIYGVPHIQKALKEFFEDFPDAILDGELYNHDLKEDFNQIVSCVKKQTPTQEELELSAKLIQYHVYDIPSESEYSFSGRYIKLQHIFQEYSIYWGDHLQLSETTLIKGEEALNELYAHYLEQGYEGQMIRNPSAIYQNKRTKDLLKRKDFIDEEYELVSINEGQGNWSGVAKSVTCRHPDGRTFNAGIKGNYERAKSLLHESYDMVTVKYFNLTPDGIPRFPVAVKFWDKEKL